MPKMLTLLIVVAACVIGVFLFLVQRLYSVPPAPSLDYDRWWGEGPRAQKEDTSIRPFTIVFNSSMIVDLRTRLSNRRPMTKPLEGLGFEYGTNSDYIQGVLNYWQHKYNFKEREDALNKFVHFKTNIQGLDIHFVRQKPSYPSGKKVLPLLMLHGWPSSSKEYLKTIPLLTTPREGYDFVFEVIAADLPGFGYSQGTTKRGLNTVQIGIIMRNLMHRLGFNKYYIHAGDWGAQCAGHMATIFQDEVLGFHSTLLATSRRLSVAKMIIGSFLPSFLNHDPKYLARIYPLSNFFFNFFQETGYFHKQATKPDTIGNTIGASPDALAVYVLNIVALGTNRDSIDKPHGGLVALDIDDILDMLTILWDNNCATTATRLYAEATWFATPEIRTCHEIPSSVPAASLNFLYEVLYYPPAILKDKYPNLVHFTVHEFGGHFAGMENPKLLVEDIFDATVNFLKFHSERNGQQTEL